MATSATSDNMQQTGHAITIQHALECFVFRTRGIPGALYRLPRLQRLSKVEQTIYYLLGEQPLESFDELASLNDHDVNGIVERLSNEGLCGYVLSRIAGLAAVIPDELVSRLRRMAATEYVTWLQADVAIHKVLEIAGRHVSSVALIKGRAVADAVYPAPQFRHSADIDVVVDSGYLNLIIDELLSAGFCLDKTNSAQFRAGPLLTIADLLLQPDAEFICCDALPLVTATGSGLDVKLDPLESGLRMIEIGRFFDNCRKVLISGIEVSTPDLVDQMLIACCHLHKDDFSGLRLLLDVHLLSMTLLPEDWRELVRRAKLESIELSIWTVLNLAVDRLRSPVPEHVFEQLAGNILARGISYLLSYRFLWNQNSLPMLILKAVFSGDRDRKLGALGRSCFPTRSFLLSYYAGSDSGVSAVPILWVLHWITILMPAGLVRRSLGCFLWKDRRLAAKPEIGKSLQRV